MTTQISSREFNQDTSGAKKAAEKGPVYVTDRGRPTHVLLTLDAYGALIGGTALTHGMAVVTRDLKDFERFDGLEVINPWR